MVLALAPNNVYAATSGNDYWCSVLDVKKLGNDGLITDESVYRVTIGMHFSVNRSTGEISGKPISNTNAFGYPEVLDNGSSEQAFKVITVYKPYVYVSYLQINEYEDGSQKPFVFYDQTTMYTGLCQHSQS